MRVNKKRKAEGIEGRIEDAYKIMKTVSERPQKDICDIYGQLTSKRLRNFDERTRDIFMHEIDGLILRAKFQNSVLPSSQPTGYISMTAIDFQRDIPTSGVSIQYV